MSSLRNAVQRRNHKERAQPLERSKWGLLEKHKDYSLRAKDHNTKKRKIKALQQKASERNEDEFYFGMMSSKTRGGVKIAQRGSDNSGSQQGAGKSLSHDVVKLMKTQDSAYLQTVLQTTRRAMERLAQEVTILEQGIPLDKASVNKKTFDDDGREIPQIVLRTDQDLDLDDLDDLDDDMDDDPSDLEPVVPLSPSSKKKQHTLEVKQRRLEALQSRQRDIEAALRATDQQRARMAGKVGGVNKNGVRFKARQRLR